eukprot:766119-Hanusia_phi.AAC.2
MRNRWIAGSLSLYSALLPFSADFSYPSYAHARTRSWVPLGRTGWVHRGGGRVIKRVQYPSHTTALNGWGLCHPIREDEKMGMGGQEVPPRFCSITLKKQVL